MRTLSYLLRESWVNMRTNRMTTMVEWMRDNK